MAAYVPSKLKKLAEQVHTKGDRPTPTPRDIMAWFDFQRRTSGNAQVMLDAFAEVKLTTDPDFIYAYVDNPVTILPLSKKPAPQEPAAGEGDVQEGGVEGPPLAISMTADPTYRIGKLPAANNRPVSIQPDKLLVEATTLMLAHDFSQLPVMTNDRTVKGMISWKSIGTRTALGQQPEFVRDCMDPHHDISSDMSIFRAAQWIIEYEAVLVRDPKTQLVCGIVTTTDLGIGFNQLSAAFLPIGEIENHVRRLIGGKYSVAELTQAMDPGRNNRTVTKPSDLTFGEYVRLLENPDMWKKAALRVDRSLFVRELSEVRRIRNETMHFDPDGQPKEDLETLNRVRRFLQRIAEVQPAAP